MWKLRNSIKLFVRPELRDVHKRRWTDVHRFRKKKFGCFQTVV